MKKNDLDNDGWPSDMSKSEISWHARHEVACSLAEELAKKLKLYAYSADGKQAKTLLPVITSLVHEITLLESLSCHNSILSALD